MLHKKTRPDAKFSIVPEEGWFAHVQKSTFYVVSVYTFIFFINLDNLKGNAKLCEGHCQDCMYEHSTMYDQNMTRVSS